MTAAERASLSLAWQPSAADKSERQNRAGETQKGKGSPLDMEEEEELDDDAPKGNSSGNFSLSPLSGGPAGVSAYSAFWNKLIQRKNSELQSFVRRIVKDGAEQASTAPSSLELLPLHLLSTVYPFPRGDKKHFSCRVRPVNNLVRDRSKFLSPEEVGSPGEALGTALSSKNMTLKEETEGGAAKGVTQPGARAKKKQKPIPVPQSWVAVANEDGTGCDDYANLAALQWFVTDAADRLYNRN
jgi:hypothetical protein